MGIIEAVLEVLEFSQWCFHLLDPPPLSCSFLTLVTHVLGCYFFLTFGNLNGCKHHPSHAAILGHTKLDAQQVLHKRTS